MGRNVRYVAVLQYESGKREVVEGVEASSPLRACELVVRGRESVAAVSIVPERDFKVYDLAGDERGAVVDSPPGPG